MIWWILIGWLLIACGGCGSIAALCIGGPEDLDEVVKMLMLPVPLAVVGVLILVVLAIQAEEGLSEDAEFWRASGLHGPQFGMGAPPKPIDIMILSNLLYFGVSGILSWFGCRGNGSALAGSSSYHKNRVQLLYMAFQLLASFAGTVYLVNYVCSHNNFLTGWGTYNYLVYVVMSSNHFNTGMSLFVDILIGGECSEESLAAATVALLVCTCGFPLAALVTHAFFALIVYCWIFLGLGGVAFVLIHTKSQSGDQDDVNCSESFQGYLLKFGLTISMTLILQWLPMCAVRFYFGDASKDYLQPVFITTSQLFDHRPWLDSIKLALPRIHSLHSFLQDSSPLAAVLTAAGADVFDAWEDVSRNFTNVSETIAFMDFMNTF